MKRIKVYIRSLSILISAGILILAGVVGAPVSAADSGGYPWADAVLLNQRTYDWGYSQCPHAVQSAGMCQAHVSRYNGVTYYRGDPWKYDVRNCTSYVAWRVHSDFGISIPRWGNASSWDDAAGRAGYLVDSNPRVGDIAVWEGYYGHVAFVTEVNADGSVNVEQYNRGGTGQFSRESRVRAQKYIHIAPTKTEPPTVVTAQKVQTIAVPATPDVTTASVVDVARNKQPVPLPRPEAKSPLPDTPIAQYDVVRDESRGGVVVYEVRFNNTATSKVELSVSDLSDGNSTWKQTWAIDQLAHEQGQASYRVADYNADGIMDLYQIKYAHSSSKQTEVRVFDGAHGYARLLGTWNTGQSTHQMGAANYNIADYNGDGQLDIYKIQSTGQEAEQIITVLSGADAFASVLGNWKAEVALSADDYIMLGDDDGDGKVDIYQATRIESGSTNVRVLSVEHDYAHVARSASLGI